MNPLSIAAVVEATWLTAWGSAVLFSWPRRPTRVVSDQTLPPAIQVLLSRRARDWVRHGVEATFVDLVRRDWIRIDVGLVEMGPGDGTSLNSAEQKVLDSVKAVTSRNPAGTAPIAALGEGPGPAGRWSAFEKATETLAKASGLIKPRLRLWHMWILVLTGPAAPLYLALTVPSDDPVSFFLAALIYGGLLHGLAVMFTLDAKVLTTAGALAASQVPPALLGDVPPVGAPRSNGTGWVFDDTGDWRRWSVAYVRHAPERGAFDAANAPILGQVVRKYKHQYWEKVGEDSKQFTDLYVVIDRGAGQSARQFIVSDTQFASVAEGDRASVLPDWGSENAAAFEVIATPAR